MTKKQLTLLYLPIIHFALFYLYFSFAQSYLFLPLFLSSVCLGVAVFAWYENKVAIPTMLAFFIIHGFFSLAFIFHKLFFFKLDAIRYASCLLINLLFIAHAILDKCFFWDRLKNIFTAVWILLVVLIFVSSIPWIYTHLKSIYNSGFDSISLINLLYYFMTVLLYYSVGRYLLELKFVFKEKKEKCGN